jgi:hypothetical protein
MKHFICIVIFLFSSTLINFAQPPGCPPNVLPTSWLYNNDGPFLIIPGVGNLANVGNKFRTLPDGSYEIWVDPTALYNNSKMSNETVLELLSLIVGSQKSLEFPNECQDAENLNIVRYVSFVHTSKCSTTAFCHMLLAADDKILCNPFNIPVHVVEDGPYSYWVKHLPKSCTDKCCQTIIGYKCKSVGVTNDNNAEVVSRLTQDYPGSSGCGQSTYYDCRTGPIPPGSGYYPCNGDCKWPK